MYDIDDYTHKNNKSGCPKCNDCKRSCTQKHKKMLWCNKCMIIGFCSKECRKNYKDIHKKRCIITQKELKSIGLGRVCNNCGTPEPNLENPILKSCKRCRSVYYCDKKCQTEHWDTHKIDCKKIEK